VLDGIRERGDPELAWLHVRIAHLQHELASDAESRAAARAALVRALEVLEANPTYAREVGLARGWLDPPPAPQNAVIHEY
jgi:hypothetical protein